MHYFFNLIVCAKADSGKGTLADDANSLTTSAYELLAIKK